jgi:hypothetical protein
MPCTRRPRWLSGSAIRPVRDPELKSCTPVGKPSEEVHGPFDQGGFEQLRPQGPIVLSDPVVEVSLGHGPSMPNDGSQRDPTLTFLLNQAAQSFGLPRNAAG